MANRRMINSDLFSDDVFMELDDLTRLTWIGLIVMSADDQGRLQDNEMLIKSQIFPMDNKPPAKIRQSIDTLEKNEMIYRYQKDGKKLIQIVNWWKHQSPSWASASNYPPPDNWVDREKYHSAGNNVVATNWDKPGGFDNLHSTLPTGLHSTLHSTLPTEQVGGLVGNESEYTIKSEYTSESDCEYTDETASPDGGTFPSAEPLTLVAEYWKSKTGELKPPDMQVLKELSGAFRAYDINQAIDHMLIHTNRPNGAYLRKVLSGWFAEKKIRKVYS